jgi:hypothetical protein
MSKNVAEAVQARSLSQFEKLISNEQLSNVVMALLGKLVVMSAQASKPIEGIAVSDPCWNGRSLKARIEFNSLSIAPMGLWHEAPDVVRYAQARSQHLAKAFDKNPGLSRFFTKMLHMIEAFCEHKGLQFADLKVEKAFITPGNMMVITFNKEHVGLWER